MTIKLSGPFQCRRCGNCCRTEGWVYVSEREIRRIARFLNMDFHDFTRDLTVREDGWWLISTPDFRPDCFLDDEGNCRIYQVRPIHCRTYPHTFETMDEYREALKICPQIAGLSLGRNDERGEP